MQNEKTDRPLWMPRGSVRAMLGLTVVCFSLWMQYKLGYVPDWIISMASTAFGFYFGSRAVK